MVGYDSSDDDTEIVLGDDEAFVIEVHDLEGFELNSRTPHHGPVRKIRVTTDMFDLPLAEVIAPAIEDLYDDWEGWEDNLWFFSPQTNHLVNRAKLFEGDPANGHFKLVSEWAERGSRYYHVGVYMPRHGGGYSFVSFV